MKILVRNLDREVKEEELLALFEAHGKVQYCKIIMDEASGKSKGFAFVEMPKPGEAKAAIASLNGTQLADYKLRVKKAQPKKAKDSPKNK